ncbi:MAG: 2-C-methyl-D-erythritol 4-phosphate cytidylyltransferase [Planctomycetota bacterium]
MARFAVLILAAGRSTRFGDENYKKPFIPLAGRAVWMHSVERFRGRADVCQVIVVVSPDDREDFERKNGAALLFQNIELCTGGAERSDSVRAGLAAVGDEATHIAVHDAARPCVTDAEIDRVFAAAAEGNAAILATPVAATLKRAAPGDPPAIAETAPRDGLWAAQTPQVFERKLFEQAISQSDAEPVTDDAQLVERLGKPVMLVPGSTQNLKITTREDLALAEAILTAREPAKSDKKPTRPFEDDDLWR